MVALKSSGGSNSAEATAIGHINFKFGKGSVERSNTGGLEDFGKALDIVIRKGIVVVIRIAMIVLVMSDRLQQTWGISSVLLLVSMS